MLKVGAGSWLVSLALDILPSFLPLGTSQDGPPAYITITPNIETHFLLCTLKLYLTDLLNIYFLAEKLVFAYKLHGSS